MLGPESSLTQQKLASGLPPAPPRWSVLMRRAGIAARGCDFSTTATAGEGSLPPVGFPRVRPLHFGFHGPAQAVQIYHRAVVNLLTSMRREPGLTAEDTLLSVTTLAFDIAALELFLPLTTGACLVIALHDVAVDGRRLARTGGRQRHHGDASHASHLADAAQAGWQGSPSSRFLRR